MTEKITYEEFMDKLDKIKTFEELKSLTGIFIEREINYLEINEVDFINFLLRTIQ